MDEFLQLLTDSDFMFFIDDHDHAFQLQLIKAQYRTFTTHDPPIPRGTGVAHLYFEESENIERSVLRDFRSERPIL